MREKQETTNQKRLHYWIGRRVQIPAWCDQWMRGDKYGEVCGVDRRGLCRVRLDVSGRVLSFSQDSLEEV